MAVAEQPTQQVAELLQNMEIGTETKSTDACEMPTRDQNNCGTSSSVLSSSEDANTMDNEGEQDVLVEQGLYYPANNYYGYYCTGYEVPGREWDEHGHFVGLDGSEIQYPGVHPESVPLVYYTPGYSYTPPPYNPYNPYIPGAVIGVDGQILGQQPYYTGPIYQHAVSSPGFYPPSMQSGSEVLPTSSPEYGPVVDAANVNGLNINTTATIPSTAHPAAVIHPHGTFSRGMLSMGIPVSSAQDCKNSDQTCEGQQRSAVSVRQPTLQGAMPSTSLSPQCSKPINQSQQQGSAIQGRVQAKGYLPFVKVPPPLHQGRVTLPLINNIADFKSNERGYAGADRLKQRDQLNGNQSNGNGNLDVLSEQNRGPRTNRTRNQWISPTALRNSGSQGVVGTVGSQGVVVNTESYGPTINKGQYNRADFPLNYDDARFFVIKSYSEDDIHKSIKYNVWSSTPNGNKRLDGAYQDAQERSGGNPGSCPVFLFFSVNASGQFCGVAEMTGPVNFKTNKDFWQQDKWNGYFPVKWHIIKDVSNSHLRHIILENNENKPVTNSRDTQEIKYSQGMEMLNIFKNYSWKTSILDDFLYYEDRQKAMQEKKSRQQVKQQQQLQPSVQAAHIQPKQLEEEPCKFDGKISRASDFNSPDGKSLSSVQAAHIQPKQSEEEPCKFDGKVGSASDFNSPDGKSLSSCVNGRQLPESIPVKHNLLGSPSIGQKEESVPLKVADRKKDESKGINCDGNGILTVGTVPIDTRVNYDNPSVLTVGTLAIDTRGVNCDIPSVVTVGTMAIDTNRTDSGIPCVITVGTVPIDPNGVKSDGRSVFTVGTVRIS